LAQVPLAAPVALFKQDWQIEVQPELQHTPSTQLPEVHSLPFWQLVPLPFFATQASFRQYVLLPLQRSVVKFTHVLWQAETTVSQASPLGQSALLSQHGADAQHT
jgi:hypothetical protein